MSPKLIKINSLQALLHCQAWFWPCKYVVSYYHSKKYATHAIKASKAITKALKTITKLLNWASSSLKACKLKTIIRASKISPPKTYKLHTVVGASQISTTTLPLKLST